MKTARFLEMFALGRLVDLPDIDALHDAGAGSGEDNVETALNDALALEDEESDEDDDAFDEAALDARPASFRLGWATAFDDLDQSVAPRAFATAELVL